jgi:NAD(P)-dependent dehydrogenase (short-subunit alcohol dehydrogenase family)
MQLQNKTAIIYGANGAIGSAVAKAFAREGAYVLLTGKNQEALESLARGIRAEGGIAQTQLVDALDEKAVDLHAKSVVDKIGKIDISFNAIAIPQTGVQGVPLVGMTAEEYLHPIYTYSRSHFITATTAARYMVPNRSGVILTLTAAPSRLAAPLLGGMAPSWAGIEALTRTLAGETGSHGVRVVCLRADGIPGTDILTEVFGLHARAMGLDSHLEFQEIMERFTLLKRLPRMNEVAETAVFLVSEGAGAITGTTINVTCGSVID